MWGQGESEGSLSSKGVSYGRPDHRDQKIIIWQGLLSWYFQQLCLCRPDQWSWLRVIIWQWFNTGYHIRLSWLCLTRRRDGSKEGERRNRGGTGWSWDRTPKYSSSSVTIFFNTYSSHQVIWPGDVVYAERFCQKGGNQVTFLVNLVVFNLKHIRVWKCLKRLGVDDIVDISCIWYGTILSWQCFS